MLTLRIPERELFDEKTSTFVNVPEKTIQLEHSLVSISKWESKWHKPFLSREEKTMEQTLDYIRCMTITQLVNPNVYLSLTPENIKEVQDYIQDPMTATTIKESNQKMSREIITNEIIYSLMIELDIPLDREKWHLNRLLTLINVRKIRSQPQKKMSKQEMLAERAKINGARRQKLNTKG